MTTIIYNVPYELAVKLDLTEGLFNGDEEEIKQNEIIENVEITFTPINGYTVEAHFKWKIRNHNYGLCVNYNTSSPYALYMCELEDYNYNSEDEED